MAITDGSPRSPRIRGGPARAYRVALTAMDAAMGRVMGVAFVAGTAMVQGLATLDGVVGFACLAAL
ncbi:hypothetical protein WLW21_24785, partial [Bordetella bronchiseptica]